jgi:septum formation protein
VGCYKIEEEGVRLFSRIEGDHFTIQGLPLIEFLSFLVLRGKLAT